MNEIRKALKPVKRRLRLIRLWKGVGFGVLLAGTLLMGVMIISFFTPIRFRATVAASVCVSALCLSALIALLLPIKDMAAARAADAHGLKERVQTALTVQADSPMTELLYENAVAALKNFDCAGIRLPSIGRQCLAGAIMLGLAVALIAVPNPQNTVIQNAIAFEKRMEEAGEMAKTEAEKPMSELSEKERQELRKLLLELSREIGESQTSMEAMLAVDEAERRLENLRERMAGDAANQLDKTLNAGGLEALAEAMESGDESALKETLETADAEELSNAADQLDGDMGDMLGAAARAARSGDTSGALKSLSQLQSAVQSGNVSQLSSASKFLSSLRNAAGMGTSQSGGQNGEGKQGSGGAGNQPGNGAGGGAGKGSSNRSGESNRNNSSGSGQGNGDPKYKEGEYERIYDPTRLDAGQTEISAQSPQGEGDSTQIQTGPGAGIMGESVPYNQVVYDYAETAAQAADSQNLTAQERRWVNSYFASLTE